MVDVGFEQGKSDNLPRIDAIMVANFYATNPDFFSAEMRGVKASRSTRESYGDVAVGYVQVKREGALCTVKGRITPEHKVRSKAYCVIIECNEDNEVVEKVECQDCAASRGGCKHGIAFLAWLHRRSEEPSPTSITCYWKKSKLSSVGTSLKFIKATDIGKPAAGAVSGIQKGEFLNAVIDKSRMLDRTNTVITNHFIDFTGTEQLSLHNLLETFLAVHQPFDVTEFESFCKNSMTIHECIHAEMQTRGQFETPLWHELRFSRITASKAYAVTHCKTTDGSLVETILGARKIRDTPAMKRGRELESKVLTIVSKERNIKLETSGLILRPEYPFIGVSPDAISEKYAVEVKCPTSEKTFRKYITQNREISAMYKTQIQLQMHFCNKTEGLFCVAHHDFGESHLVDILVVDYDADYCEAVLEHCRDFWVKNIVPKLIN